jgi:phosphoribosylaminoimidazolecarboxamide formyltransferase/IMP cyclohydrolase
MGKYAIADRTRLIEAEYRLLVVVNLLYLLSGRKCSASSKVSKSPVALHRRVSVMRVNLALLSVYDKTNITEFAHGLSELGVDLLSTGGTARVLTEKGIRVQEISDYTGFPEILGGRVKSLHPKIHAGLLYRRNNQNDREIAEKMGIRPIDMVVVNLYPFETVTARKVDLEEAIENIDIGGPSMIRAAAKNYQNVAVLTDPFDYSEVLRELKSSGCTLSDTTCFRLMMKAFERTAAYDANISCFFNQLAIEQGIRSDWPGPSRLLMNFEKLHDLRYGENPHQKAAVYRESQSRTCIAAARLVAGQKELSYTNILDADATYSLLRELRKQPTTTIIKHTNPCGVGRGTNLAESCKKALETDPLSAFGGVYGFTRPVDLETARILSDKFVELVLAPGYNPDALATLSSKKNRRIIDISEIISIDENNHRSEKTLRKIHGGILYQDSDDLLIDQQKLKTVTKRQPTVEENESLLFAWIIVKHTKSNAIVIASRDQLVGVGAGQMSRVDSCKIAIAKAKDAKLQTAGCVMASDAFLPFRDSVDLMGEAKVSAIIQPGGSVRDQEVIDAANEFGMAMLFSGLRHFAH